MSTLPQNAMGGRKVKGCIAEVRFSAPLREISWDIAKDVMYCHLCGALSEPRNRTMWLFRRALCVRLLFCSEYFFE